MSTQNNSFGAINVELVEVMALNGCHADWQALSSFVAEEDKPGLQATADCQVLDNHRALNTIPACGLVGPILVQRLTMTAHDPSPSVAEVTHNVLRRWLRWPGRKQRLQTNVDKVQSLEGVICVMALAVSDELASIALMVLSSLNANFETPQFPLFSEESATSNSTPELTLTALSKAVSAYAEQLSREVMDLVYFSPQLEVRRDSLGRRGSRYVLEAPLVTRPPDRSSGPLSPPPKTSEIPRDSRPSGHSPPSTQVRDPTPPVVSPSIGCGLFSGIRRRFQRSIPRGNPPKSPGRSISHPSSTSQPNSQNPRFGTKRSDEVFFRPPRQLLDSTTRTIARERLRTRNTVRQADAAPKATPPNPQRPDPWLDHSEDVVGELAEFPPRAMRSRAVTEDSIALSSFGKDPFAKPTKERRKVTGFEESELERMDRYCTVCVETLVSVASCLAFARECNALAVVLRVDNASGVCKGARTEALERALGLWLLSTQGPEMNLPCLFAGNTGQFLGMERLVVTPIRLRRGDHIYRQIRLKGGLSYLTHHGIYLGDGLVIHFSGNEESISTLIAPSQKNTHLRKSSILDFMKYGGNLHIERYGTSSEVTPSKDSLRYERGWPSRNSAAIFALADHDEYAARRAEFAYAHFHWNQSQKAGSAPFDAGLSDLIRDLAGEEFKFPNYNVLTNNCEHFCRWCKTGSATSMQADLFTVAVDAFVRGFARDRFLFVEP